MSGPEPDDLPPTEPVPATEPIPSVPTVFAGPVVPAVPPADRPRNPQRRFSRDEVRVVAIICACIVAIGIVAGVLATRDSGDGDGPSVVTTAPATAPASSSTSSSSSTTTTTIALPPLAGEADPALTAQVRTAVDAAVPGSSALITGAFLNLLGNLKILTTLGDSSDFADTAFGFCQVGKALGFTDVEVRSARGHNLASTGIVNNQCKRHA